jgi:diguanylate cyclase (GGDEF)-like protein/PAS domain S-box-containing protein
LGQLELALREQQIITDTAGVAVAFIKQRVVIRCNQRFAEIYGHPFPAKIVGHSCASLYRDEAAAHALWEAADPQMAKGVTYQSETLMKRGDGTPFWAHLTGKLVNPSDPDEGFIWITMDISTQKETENELLQARTDLEEVVKSRTLELRSTVLALEQKAMEQAESERLIQKLVHFDPLTGLPNRLLFEDRGAHALSAARRNQQPLVLMFLDLDHFKNVNDSLGHRVGDEVLAALAQRLHSVVREQDTVARLGGDEFTLLLPNTDASGAVRVAEKVSHACILPFHVGQHELTVTLSVGIARYPDDGQDLDTLSRYADAAMYHAKAEGRNNYRFFTKEIQAQSDRALLLDNALRRALERNQMQLHFQPQISLGTGQIVGAEALLRWNHPQLGSVSPAEFIPVAENNGQILPIGEWVLRTALKQLGEWIARGMAPITLAVNLSVVQFRHANLPQLVSSILLDADLTPELLELELTEGVAMTHPLSAVATMDDLHRRGVRMSIDDFGTGYSSLSYLKRFQVYKLKIDQSFVRDITDDPDDKAIVGAIISMASSLGLKTIAEGVETAGQLAFLRARGCDEVQGYFFSRPLPADAFELFTQNHRPELIQAPQS